VRRVLVDVAATVHQTIGYTNRISAAAFAASLRFGDRIGSSGPAIMGIDPGPRQLHLRGIGSRWTLDGWPEGRRVTCSLPESPLWIARVSAVEFLRHPGPLPTDGGFDRVGLSDATTGSQVSPCTSAPPEDQRRAIQVGRRLSDPGLELGRVTSLELRVGPFRLSTCGACVRYGQTGPNRERRYLDDVAIYKSRHPLLEKFWRNEQSGGVIPA
jgi:hypothetical protein